MTPFVSVVSTQKRLLSLQNKLALLSFTTGGTAEMYTKNGVSGDFRYFLWPLQVLAAPLQPLCIPRCEMRRLRSLRPRPFDSTCMQEITFCSIFLLSTEKVGQ